MKIGLIGLGIMGKPMAKNILKGGYTDLLVSDLNTAAVEEVVAAGAKSATNKEIGESCDVVLTMLPNSPHVKSVMLGENGVAGYMKPGTVFIDMSSLRCWLKKTLICWMRRFRAVSRKRSTVR